MDGGRWTDNAGRVAGRLLFSFNVLLLISYYGTVNYYKVYPLNKSVPP